MKSGTRLAFMAVFLFSWAILPQVRAETQPAPAPADEPTLAHPPAPRTLVPARIPPGTTFPSPDVVVVLEIDVDETGRVVDVRNIQGVGEPFDSAAVEAARASVFEPGVLTTGEAVPVTVTFRMRIEAPPPAPVTLSGRLVERGTRKPLSAVPIQARKGEEVMAQAETDEDGRFSIEVPAASFRIVALPSGHEKLDVTIEASPGEQRDVTWYLESAGSPFETVVRAAAVRTEVTRRVIPKETVESVAGTSGDALKAVQNLPGVARPSFGGGAPILRGASPGDSRTFLEGHEIPLLYHFFGLRSTFSSVFLDQIDFVPGNFASDFGRATGGIIDVKMRDPASDLFRGLVDINLYDAGFALEGPIGKGWSVGGAFRRSWIDAILPAVLPDESGVAFPSLPRFYDYQLMTTWKPDERRKLRLFFYGSLDTVKVAFDEPGADPEIRGAIAARIMFHDLQASYESRLLETLRQTSSLQVGLQQFRTRIGPSLFFDLDVRRISLRTVWTWDIHPIISLRAGLDLLGSDVEIGLNSPSRGGEGDLNVPVSVQERFSLTERTFLFEPGLFMEIPIRPVKGLEVLPGVRIDGYVGLDRVTVDPRLQVRWDAYPGTVIKGGVGLYQQPPTPDRYNGQTGTPGILAERSLQASLGVEQRIVDGVDFDVTGFYKHLDRLAVVNPAFAGNPTADRYASIGKGRILGLEAQFKARVSDWFSGWIAYTFQRSFRTDAPGAAERPFDFDQPHILTALGTFQLGRSWSTGFRFRLVSGNPTTPVTGSVYDVRTDVYVPVYGAKNSDRLPLFHQLDLRVDKFWTFEAWKFSIYLDVQNVYNRKNPEGISYSFDYSQSTPSAGLPILPILGVKGEW